MKELRMSVMVSEKKGYAAITIRKLGFGSTALFNKRKGEILEFVAVWNQFKIGNNTKKGASNWWRDRTCSFIEANH
jgi:hypothetical protein